MAEKVDFVFLPEGYTEAEMGKFEADARRFIELLFLHRVQESYLQSEHVY